MALRRFLLGLLALAAIVATISACQPDGAASVTAAIPSAQPSAVTSSPPAGNAVPVSSTSPARSGEAPSAVATAASTRAPSPVPTSVTQSPMASSAVGAEACRVTSAKLLSQGGDQDWSAVNGLIVFDQPDSSGVSQLATIRPDGSDLTCLSCQARTGAPRTDRHKLGPIWHPSGRFIVVGAEVDSHPLDWASRVPLMPLPAPASKSQRCSPGAATLARATGAPSPS